MASPTTSSAQYQSLENGLTAKMANKRKITKIASAMKNRIFAIPAVAAERPEKPKKPATREITKKISAHFSIAFFPLSRNRPRSGTNHIALRPLVGLTVRACALGPRGHSPQAAALASPDIADLSCTRARCTRLFRVPIAQPIVSDTSS